MKTLIVDDEPLARTRLAALLAEVGGIEVVGMAGDGRHAVELAAQLAPELVVLDIDMPLMGGLEAARHLARLGPAPAVIFCTAYDEHALAAFEAQAIDYLVKPVRLERLREALARARRYGGAALAQAQAGQAPTVARTHLCARLRGDLALVPVGEVHYLLAEDKYTIVRHARGEALIEEPLKALEREFGERFVRIHRNCLVARGRLAGLERDEADRIFARIAGSDARLEASRRHLPMLRKLVKSL